jgi:hypothetical protein
LSHVHSHLRTCGCSGGQSTTGQFEGSLHGGEVVVNAALDGAVGELPLGVITEIFSGTPGADLKPGATYP